MRVGFLPKYCSAPLSLARDICANLVTRDNQQAIDLSFFFNLSSETACVANLERQL